MYKCVCVCVCVCGFKVYFNLIVISPLYIIEQFTEHNTKSCIQICQHRIINIIGPTHETRRLRKYNYIYIKQQNGYEHTVLDLKVIFSHKHAHTH